MYVQRDAEGKMAANSGQIPISKQSGYTNYFIGRETDGNYGRSNTAGFRVVHLKRGWLAGLRICIG